MSPTRSERVRQASQARRAQQKEDVRQAILQAGVELFQEQGYEGFSLRQVAERIGYSATTIYLYFKDKDDLLSVLVEENFSHYAAMIQEAASEHQDPMPRLAAIGRAYVRFGISHPAFFRGAYLQRPDILFKLIGPERLQAGGYWCKAALREAIDAGQIPPGDVEEIAHALWATMHGIVTLAVTFPGALDNPNDVVERAIQIVNKGLR